MKRIATPNRAIDKFAAGKDGFRAAVAGVSSATEFSDLWFNHVQEAVCRTIEAAGAALSDTDFDQFTNALNTIIGNAGEQFSTVRSLAVSAGLTVADLGKLIKITAPGTTQTFPPVASCRAGTVLSFATEYAAGITTLKANAAELLVNPLGATANTFSLNAGESIQFVSNGASWDPIGYEATVGVTPNQFDDSPKLATTAFAAALGRVLSPAGMVSHFAMSAAPTGWLKANGAAVSRTAYASLFAAIGTTFGAGDGSTTFTLPDLRGEFVRGLDDSRGADPSRALGTSQRSTAIRTIMDYWPDQSSAAIGAWDTDLAGGVVPQGSNSGTTLNNSAYFKSNGNIALPGTGSSDNQSFTLRPRNVALLACIKY